MEPFKKSVQANSVNQIETGLKIGRYNRLGVQTRSGFGVYLATGDDRILLPNKLHQYNLAGGAGDFTGIAGNRIARQPCAKL